MAFFGMLFAARADVYAIRFALRGRMNLARNDRLFPSQDLLPAGGVGNLIAAPLFKPARRNGATVFLDPQTLEPHKDQWAYLSTLGRMTPHELKRAADRVGCQKSACPVSCSDGQGQP